MNNPATRVVNIRLHHDVGIDEGPFANPFQVGVDGQRKACIEKYRQFLFAHPELVLRARKELKGKRLGTRHAPQENHGDVLIEFIDGKYKDLDPTPALRKRVSRHCEGKIAYNQEDAWRTARRLHAQGRDERRAYLCDHCGAWHITSQARARFG